MADRGAIRSLVDACLWLFVAALLLFAAVQLIRSIYLWLLAGAGVLVAAMLLMWIWRSRRERW